MDVDKDAYVDVDVYVHVDAYAGADISGDVYRRSYRN